MTTIEEIKVLHEKEFRNCEEIIGHVKNMPEEELIRKIIGEYHNLETVVEKIGNLESNSSDYLYETAHTSITKIFTLYSLNRLLAEFFFRTIKKRDKELKKNNKNI